MIWLPGFHQLVFNHSLGGSFDRPPRAVEFHTTEGATPEGAFSVYAAFPSCPHFTVDPDTHARYQHVPLDSASYAMRNLPGGCQTNSTGIVQIEIVGYAAESWSWSQARLQWLGEQVLAPILAACPTIPVGPIYSGPKMTGAQWDFWTGGLCGHRDVPENDHTDPGDLDLAKILAYAGDNMPLSDDDIKRVAEAVWSRILDIEGTRAPAAEWVGYQYAQITRTAAQGGVLMKNITDLIDEKVITVGDTP